MYVIFFWTLIFWTIIISGLKRKRESDICDFDSMLLRQILKPVWVTYTSDLHLVGELQAAATAATWNWQHPEGEKMMRTNKQFKDWMQVGGHNGLFHVGAENLLAPHIWQEPDELLPESTSRSVSVSQTMQITITIIENKISSWTINQKWKCFVLEKI